MLLGEKEARALCEKVLRLVQADDAEVTVTSEQQSHLRFAANTFTTSGYREDTTVGVTVWFGGKAGSAVTNEIDGPALRAVVVQAEELARRSLVDPEYLPTLGPLPYQPAAGYRATTAAISPAERARAINDTIAACEKEKVIGAGFHQAGGLAYARATRNGNFAYRRSSLVSFSLTARTPDGSGSGFFAQNHFDAAKLDAARVTREAIRKGLHSRDARALDPGVYTVILEPQAVADLLSFLALSPGRQGRRAGQDRGAFSARAADEGRSAFSAPGGKTRLGERIFDQRLSLLSDPWHPELPGAPATPEGIPTQKLYLVRNGVLENLVYTRHWAQQKAKTPTAGPVNTILQSSAPAVSLEEMIQATPKGLLVTRFTYIRPLNPRSQSVTGLTRDGLWYVEHGKIQYPVRNFRFNQSLLEMLAPGNVELIGAPQRFSSSDGLGQGALLVPALKVKQFHFTSQSDAV